jgi:hypothetical protein
MEALGRLEDLPQDYRDELTAQNLVPLWPSLRALLPPGVPARRTQATAWAYQAVRPLLMRAGELTPIEIKASRTFNPEFIKRLKTFEALDPRIKPGAVVYAGEAEQQFQGCRLLPFTQTESLF